GDVPGSRAVEVHVERAATRLREIRDLDPRRLGAVLAPGPGSGAVGVDGDAAEAVQTVADELALPALHGVRALGRPVVGAPVPEPLLDVVLPGLSDGDEAAPAVA